MVNSCTPFPTAILCWWFLGERFTRIQGICCGQSFVLVEAPRLKERALSILGVSLIANPLGPSNDIAGPGNVEDHIPVEPVYKLVGLLLAIPSTLIISAEGTSVTPTSDIEVLLTRSVVIMRKMGDHVGHVQVLATLAIAPAVITAW
jgi:hypothetical protein